MKLKSNQTLFDRSSSNLTSFFVCFELKNFKVSQWFSNRNFSFLRLKLTQIMEIIPNQTFFHGTYSNLTPYIFLSRNIEAIQWLQESKFFSFMTEVNSNNGNETKSDIFQRIYWNLTSFFVDHKILNHFSDFYNWHLSFSSQNWA